MGNKAKCKTTGCENKCEKRKKFCVKCHVANQTTKTVKCWNCDKDHPGLGQFCPYCGELNSGVKEEATPSTASDVTSKLKRPNKEDVETLTGLLPKRKLECSASGDASLSQDTNIPTQGQPGTISETSTNGRHNNKPSKDDHNKVDASSDSGDLTTSTVMPNILSQDSNRPTQGQPGTSSETSTNGRHKNKPSKYDQHKVDASSYSGDITTSTVMPNNSSQDSNRPNRGQPGTISETSINERQNNEPSKGNQNKVDASRVSGDATTSTVMPNIVSQDSNRSNQGKPGTISETSINERQNNEPSKDNQNKVHPSRGSGDATTSTVIQNNFSQDSNRPNQGQPGTISETSINGRQNYEPSKDDHNKVSASSDSGDSTTGTVMPNILSQDSNRPTQGQPGTSSETSTNGRYKNKPSKDDQHIVDASSNSGDSTTSTVMPNTLSQDSNRPIQGQPGIISVTSISGRQNNEPSNDDHKKVNAFSDSGDVTTSTVMTNILSQDSKRHTQGQPGTSPQTSTNGRHKNKPSKDEQHKVDASSDSGDATTITVMPNSLSQNSNRPTQGQPGTSSETSTNRRQKNKPSTDEQHEVDASSDSRDATTITVMPNSLFQDSNRRPNQGQPGTISEINERQNNEPSKDDHNKVAASIDSGDSTTGTVMPNILSQDSNRPTQGQPGTSLETSKNGRHKSKPCKKGHNKTNLLCNQVEANSSILPNESHKPSIDSSGKQSNSISAGGQLTTGRKNKMDSAAVVIQEKEQVPSAPLDDDNISTDKSASDCTSKDGGDFSIIEYNDEKFKDNYATEFPSQWQPNQRKSTEFNQVGKVFGGSEHNPESVRHTFGVNQSNTSEMESCVDVHENIQAVKDTSSSTDSKNTTDKHTGSDNFAKTKYDTLNQQVITKNLQSNQSNSGGKETVAASEDSTPNQNTCDRQGGNNHFQNPDQLMDTREDESSYKCENEFKSESPPSYAEIAASTSQPPLKDGECDNRRGHTTTGNSKGKKNPNNMGNVKTPSGSAGGKKEDKMTVCFHTVVTPEFNFNPETDTIIMRLDVIGGFQKDVGKMEVERSESNYVFVKIELTLNSSHFSRKGIRYKYVLKRCIKGQQGPTYIWEFIDKNPNPPGHVNRLLKIPKEACHKEENFHQHDSALHVEKPVKNENIIIRSTKSFLNKMIGKLWKTGTADKDMKLRRDHEIATQSYMPQWEGFVCQHDNQNVTSEGAVKAFKKLCLITEQMSSSSIIANGIAEKWIPGNFSMKEVLQNYFDEKLDEISNNEKDKDVSSICQQLISALAIAMVEEKYSFLEYATRHKLLRALVLPSCLKKSDYENLIRDIKKEFSGQMMSMVTKALETLCNNAMCSTGSLKMDLTFLLVLPILHFLREDSKPMEWPEYLDQFGFQSDSWWGHGTLNVKSLRRQDIDQNPEFLPILVEIKSLFQVDHLLQRSFLATVKFQALEEILKQIKFDFHVACSIVGLSIILQKYFFSFEDKLKLMLSVLVKNAQEENSTCSQRCEEKWHQHQSTNVTDVLLNIFLVLVDKTNDTQIVLYFLHLFSEALRNVEIHCGKELNSTQDRLDSIIQKASEIVIQYLSSHIYFITSSDYLEILNGFFNITFGNKKVNDRWISCLSEFLLRKLKMASSERIIEFYCCIKDPSPYHPVINRALSDEAFKAIDLVMMNRHSSFGMFSFFDTGMRSSNRVGDLLSSFINRSLSHQTMTLKKCLTWHPLSGFLKMADINFLGTEARTNITRAKSVVEDIVCRLFNGEITVEELGDIQQHEEDFLALIEEIDLQQIINMYSKLEKETNRKGIVLEILRCRQAELHAFVEEQQCVGTLINFCSRMQHESASTGTKKLAVDISEIITAHNADVSQVQLHKLCKLIPVEVAIFSPSRVDPVVSFFNLSDNVSNMLLKMEKIHSSGIFQQFWKKRAAFVVLNWHSKDSLMALDVVEAQVWRFVKGEWDQLKEQLVNGSISLYGVDNKLGKIMDDCLENNLKVFEDDDTIKNYWIKERCDQVRLYRQLKKCVQSAKIILEIRKEFGLKGDFRSVELLYLTSKEEFKGKCLSDLNEDVEITCRELKNVTEEQIRCLQTLINCKDLILWIKKEIENMHELKVFVDLAMIQAGETPMEVYRVSCLHQAATGYSAFIFNLTEWSGYKHLMTICSCTWKALENDPNLSIKLADISREMEWVKGIKESHGSVEVLSLHQVERINAEGIYEIGKLKEGSLRLRVEAEDGKEMIYTVEQIKDLQSKLMLIAGEAYQCTDAKTEVNRFVEVFVGAQDLEKYYQKMRRSGNVLFSNLKITLHCKISTKAPVYIDFCVTGQESLFGNKELTDILKELTNFMKVSLKQWYDYIDEKREEFYYLNVYTTKQLVILQHALARFGEEDISPEVYDLLSLVKPDCTVQDLRKAVTEVEKEKESESNVDETCEGIYDQIGDSFFDEEKEQMSAFWKKMDNMMDEEEAMAVLEENGLISVEEAVTYISEFPYSKERLNILGERFITRVGCTLSKLGQNHDEETESEQQIENVVRDEQKYKGQIHLQNRGHGTDSLKKELLFGINRFEGTLIDKLNHVWKNYLSSTKSADLTDYVSVETLGRLLKHLATFDCQATIRSLPQLLKRGRPNLIVCPANDVLHTVLSVYMEGNGSLPAYDEVLLCNSLTSLEEVVLLWRRALNGSNVKTYCLVNADALDYDVSVDAVKKLHELMEGKAGYKLVIICDGEREHQSHMVNALHSDRISSDKPTCTKNEEIQNYLRMQFIQQVQPQLEVRLLNDRTCVQCISSNRPGVGKSLLIQRYKEQLQRDGQHLDCCITVPLQTTTVQEHDVAKTLISQIQEMDHRFSRIVHLDVSPNVSKGLDHLLFNLLILNTICAQDGLVWRRHFYDLYLVEITKARDEDAQQVERKSESRKNIFLESLPTVLCRPPKETLEVEDEQTSQESPSFHDYLMDDIEFRSSRFQRPYQYLAGLYRNADLDAFNFSSDTDVYGDHVDCLKILLWHCGLPDPSWSELSHFACFLDKQLEDCESSVFCDPGMLADTGLNGFKTFVVKFMLQMAKDFATPSLQMSIKSSHIDVNLEDEENLQAFQLRRRWENSPHPYIFFNHDHVTMTFMGFSINRNGALLDVDGEVLQRKMMSKSLMRGLKLQNVNLEEDFDSLPRDQKLHKLCMVMGIENISNPDETYELTTDNAKKILAIHMRFRCCIPVIVMGETGCGKTRLIRFMCQLHSNGLVVDQPVKNMILMKVHGGTSSEYIVKRVHKALELAQENKTKYKIDTVLFFDEANTTEAIGIIKEIMCDGRMNGQQIDLNGSGLKIVAACNPYKRHTKEMIHRLEAAGLGYHIKASKTTDRLGRIPLRQLVYRVQALPPSMLPLVWDFGQLNSTVEIMYIRQIVQRYFKMGSVQLINILSKILSTAQAFMREQKNECSFVSLRDVERTLNVMAWFLSKRTILRGSVTLEESVEEESVEVENVEGGLYSDENDDPDEIVYVAMDREINDHTWAMVLALGVCYHACLDEKREDFRNAVAESFDAPLNLYGGSGRIFREINRCQDIFLEAINLGPNIARNMALKENIFMMIICIELRIPLFLVGKPGSSKSLAKTIVNNAMQGDSAATPLFKELKQVHMISYQCSPLSTPDGIVGTFRQCSRFQESKDLKKFVSVVILDEVGLAEDSPKMPLKTLHPLLEYGCEEDDNPPPHKKVGFIGISNWALDPAKMNRGILVSRGVPKDEELIESALGICESENSNLVSKILKPLAEGYLQIYKSQDRDFYGLRDFYSLIKMVNQFAKNSGKEPTWAEIEHAIRRNFGGIETEDHIKIIEKKLESYVRKEKCGQDPDCSPSGLIKASLYAQGQTKSGGKKKVGHGTSNGDSRYLLVLTEKFAALPILMNMMGADAIYIYGSSFPFDQEYTQVCRNINRIKLCMEAGKTVVLLNLENLYESLYDALNQYYVYFGGQRYVDLGLGSHRVKCRVHESFRLVVVADKKVVHEEFPIPLINRLEKHCLTMTTMLSEKQLRVVERLKDWVSRFTTIKQQPHLKTTNFKETDAFVGYHGDTIAALVYQTLCEDEDEVFEKVKYQLLTCATPESVTRLIKTDMPGDEREEVMITYFRIQKHGCLADYLADKIQKNHCDEVTGILGQVTTYSRLLTEEDLEALAESTKVDKSNITMVSLQEFQHEQQFSVKVQKFFDENRADERLLLVQCDASSDNSNLISCACYQVQTERADRENAVSKQGNRRDLMHSYQMDGRAHVFFIIQLQRVSRCFQGFQGGLWSSSHIDDLQPPKKDRPDVYELMDRKMSDLFTVSKKENLPGVLPSELKVPIKEHSGYVTHEDTTLVDFTAVILDSIHPATARIADPANQRHRSTERVRLLVELLKKDSSQLEFLHSLKQHILKLVKEKEDRSCDAYHWLTREALDIKEVQESGTFRQAGWQRLTATVAPLLAEVIAVCDISDNLSLLESQEADKAWLHQLWLNIFSSADLMKISSDLSPVQGVQRSEVPVLGKGYGGKSFVACFPFSWIIKAKVDDIGKFSSECKVGGTTSYIQQFLRNVKSEIGQILKIAIMIGGPKKVIHCYCSDFINMSCKISQNEEHKLICENLINASYSIVQELELEVDSVDYVAAVHLAFNKLRKRFEHFSQLIDSYPDVLNSEPDEEGLDTEEMTIDVSSLKYVLRGIDCKDVKSQDEQRNWLNNIHKLCPVVQCMIGLYNKNKDDFGPESQKILEECRCLWSRITVMKLFFEHVCLPNEDFAKIVSPKCRALWTALKTTADFKSDTSVNILVNTLNEVNRKAGEAYYKSGIHKCGMCQESIEDPVLLPCKPEHVVCKECIEDYFRSKQTKECPICKFDFLQDFECEVQSEVSEVVAKHNAFRQCCNSFFMEVVSQLCFSDGTPPSEEVIKRLLGYVTLESKKKRKRVTRKVSPFPEDCIDPNPVVRSFLLQLLLQSNLETVKEHVQEYLKNSRDLFQESAEDVVSLCTLFVNCLEDTYYSRSPQDSKQIHMLIDDAHGKLTNVGKFFRRQNFTKDPLSVELLEAISQIRFAFSTLADITHYQQEDEERYCTINIKRLFNMLSREARVVCEQNEQAQLYLVKYICRAFGRDALTHLKDDNQLNWILPEELNVQDQCIPDNFVIIGKTYINIREAIGQCMVDKDFEKMFKAIKDVQGQNKDKEVCLLLALFREITMNAATTVEAKRISSEVKMKFGEVIQKIPFLKNKAVADTLLQNREQNHNHVLRVNPEKELLDYSIQAAVTHLQIVLNAVKPKSLTQCLATLMRTPSQMQQAYLPAMPQDNSMEAKAALHRATTDHKLTWYECPRGHLYTIGNCGKPNETGQCPECKSAIGGRRGGKNELQEGNKLANMVDTTRRGHVLGNPQMHQSNQIVCERTMNCMETAIIRFLLHASMLLGTECQHGPQAIINIIKPAPDNVLEFLWKHLHNDVRLLSASTGKSRDDCIFVLHKVIDNILHKNVQADFQSGFQQLLPSRKCRKTWEDNFLAVYIKPALQGLDEMIDQSNQTLVSDKRLSHDPVMRLLHTSNSIEAEDLGKLAKTSHVWQYRSRITILCINQALASEEDGTSFAVLRLFMEKEKHLRVVQHLPDIIRLQRLLINKYNRHIDSAEAANLKISTFLSQVHATEREEFKSLIDTFINVWNSVRLDVAVKLQIPQEVMSSESSIAMLLPTRQDSGLCATGLVDFLIITQNEFLERYHSIKKLQMSQANVISPSDLLPSHLIAYDLDRDLLPLILSQCQYIVRPMAGNKIEYNLQGLELQIVERFVRGRAFIERKFDQLFFRQFVRNASIFKSLRDKIPQVELTSAVKCSIVTEIKSFQNLCKSLALLDIAIGFLANYKAEGDMLIKEYLQDKLAMPVDKGLISSTASQQCRLKHILALWQVLAVEKALRLTIDAQDPFVDIGEDYRELLNEQQRNYLNNQLKYIKVDLLCAELFEYIVLNLSHQSTNTEDRTNWPILDTLDSYYESKNENGEISGLDEFPDTLLMSHAVDTWRTIAQFHNKQPVQG